MATSPTVSNLPEGYTLEASAQPPKSPSTATSQQSQVSGLPPGYTLETPTPSQTVQGLPDGYTLEQPGHDQEKSNYISREQQASNIRQSAVAGLTGMPTPNMTDADRANFESGKTAGAVTAGGAEVLSPLVPAAGVIPTVIEHLGGLTKIVQAAKTLGWTGMSLKEAHDIYKMITEATASEKK